MLSPRVRIGLCTTVMVWTVVFCAWADGGADADALRCFDEGVSLFNTGQYGPAAEKFREAYRLKPSWKLLYNIGQSAAASKRYGRALESFERFLSEGGDDVAPERRDEVLAEVERLRKMVGFVRVSAPAGTTIYIDGEARGTAPLNSVLPISSGVVHAVSGELDGELFFSEDVKIIGGRTVDVSMSRAAGPPPVAPVEAEPAEKEEPQPVDEPADVEVIPPEKGFPFVPVGWALSGTGAAAAIAGGIVGGLALAKNNELVAACGDDPCPEKADEVETQRAMGNASTALLAAGGTVLVTGVVLLVVGKLKEKRESAGVSAGIFVDEKSAGASMAVRF